LQRAQLLSLTPASRLRYALARNRERRLLRAAETALTALERINISSRRVQPFFRRAYRWGGRLLFTPVALVGCVLLACAGCAAAANLWRDADVVAGFGAYPLLAIITVKLLFILTLAAHQIVHGLALVHYGRRVREFGFTFLHGFLPTFYVDVTDIFMASRRARIVTAVSGTLVHLVFGSLWFMLALRASDGGFVQAFAAASGIIQWQAVVLAFCPFCFVEMAGSQVLVDVLGAPTLKHDAMGYMKSLFAGRRAPVSRRQAGLWIGYIALSIVSIAAFVAFNVWVVIHATS